MNVLQPVALTPAMLTSSSVAEPSPGETVWVSAAACVLGDRRIRTQTHRVYECIQAHTGRSAVPEADPLYWEDVGPTNRWAPFDAYVSTPARAATSMTYRLAPGFFDAVSVYGMEGETLTIVVRDGPGGAVLFTKTLNLARQATGLFEYLTYTAKTLDRAVVPGIPLSPLAELEVTIAGGGAVALGMVNVGLYRRLALTVDGGTAWGASVEPMTYSRIATNEFGETRIKRGHRASGMRADVMVPLADASYVLRIIQDVLDVPVSWVASDVPGFAGLNVFGLGSASLVYQDAAFARLALTVRGMI